MAYANDQPQQQQYTPPTAQQLAGSFNPGAFGGGSGPNGPPQVPFYGVGDPTQNQDNLLMQLGQYLQPFLQQQGVSAQDMINQIMQQAGLSQQQFGLQEGQAKQEAGFSLQQLGLQQQGLGIQQGALDRQANLIPQLQDLANQGFSLRTQESWQGAQAQQQGLNSALTSSGAYTSVGGNQQRGQIQQNLANSLQGIGIQQKQSDLSFADQIASNADAQKQLGLTAKQLGLSEQEVSARLQNTLAQLGLSNQITGDQFFEEVTKIQNGQYSDLSSIIGSILSQSGLTVPSGG